jgi:hypothetical protein
MHHVPKNKKGYNSQQTTLSSPMIKDYERHQNIS